MQAQELVDVIARGAKSGNAVYVPVDDWLRIKGLIAESIQLCANGEQMAIVNGVEIRPSVC